MKYITLFRILNRKTYLTIEWILINEVNVSKKLVSIIFLREWIS